MTIDQFLTDAQIKRAQQIFREAPTGTFCTRVVEEIIQSNMAEINRKLGQENDARFLGYAVEHVFTQAGIK